MSIATKKLTRGQGIIATGITVGLIAGVLNCVDNGHKGSAPLKQPQVKTVKAPSPPQQTSTPKKRKILPVHKFMRSKRLGRSRSQIRAIAKAGTWTEEQFRQAAVDLSHEHENEAAGAFLVTFVSDPSLLNDWKGTGTVKPANWPHWLCWVTVDTNPQGELNASKFGLASVLEPKGIGKRSDVLKK